MRVSIKTESLENLLAACEGIADKYRTFAPTSEDGVTGFRPLDHMTREQRQSVATIALDNKPPVGSIKSFFFPDSEIYIKFAHAGRKVAQIKLEAMGRQLLLGAKTCDLRSVEMIDKVFLAEPIDSLYQEKREKTIVIAAVCSQSGETCRCHEFGISPVASTADLVLERGSGGEVYLTAQTAKGEELAGDLFAQGSFVACERMAPSGDERASAPLSSEQIQRRMDELFASPLWDKLAMTCLGCGTCTYYCPTCHCYDIRDFSRRDQGVRYRTWDSCMFASFTNMAGGHNPRPNRSDRLRNRFFHKLNYFVKTHGELACVGCGRCAELCPVGISISSVLKEIGSDLHES